MKKVTFITMFGEPIESWLRSSIIGRAAKRGLISGRVISILEHLSFDHHKADDTPYGGGPGELLRIDVIAPLIERALEEGFPLARDRQRVLLMDPTGKPFDQLSASRLAGYDALVFISGRYEGIDARVHHYVDESLSLGDFVLSSGDPAAMAMFDAIARMIPGILGNSSSAIEESHARGRLEASLYTRPKSFDGHEVPLVYQGGDHRRIAEERSLESVIKTKRLRPDLIERYPLDPGESALLRHGDGRAYPWMKSHG